MLKWLRNAFGDAPAPVTRADIEELEHRMEMLRLEWGDILDKLVAREDRERKRLARAAQTALQAPEDTQSTLPLHGRRRRLLGGS
ncbi:hypothetical protein FDZ71_02735 [bacterium]|nr:MAG: hypothetical protein FDZ71_02735 [bacterium]